jgi:hypothetical protein
MTKEAWLMLRAEFDALANKVRSLPRENSDQRRAVSYISTYLYDAKCELTWFQPDHPDRCVAETVATREKVAKVST